MCTLCWQRNPDRAAVRGEHLIAELADTPEWVRDFVAYLAARHCPARAARMIGTLSGLLTDGSVNHPPAVLDRARRPGRSMGSLARALEGFFVERGLALPTDQAERLAAGRRQRRIDGTPTALRPAVQAFSAEMLQTRRRARAAATRPRSDHTIEMTLTAARDLAIFLQARGKSDWSLVDVHDVEAFIAALPKTRSSRISLLRQFFRFARAHRIVLVDPTRGLSRNTPRGFTGATLPLAQQRDLFHRWTSADPAVHAHEALLGILALLHGASSSEVRMLRTSDIDPAHHTVRLGRRPHPVPLDPASWSALQRCLTHRQSQSTENPHIVVTRGTKAGKQPASTAYFSHLLDPAGVAPRTVRCTRLAALVNTMDPKLVAAAFGLNNEGVMFYLADRVDDARLPAAASNSQRFGGNPA